MSRFTVLVSLVFLAAFVVPSLVPNVSAEVPIPTLTVYIRGETNGPRQQFSPERILIPQVPIDLVVHFHNNDTIPHTFTIDDENNTVPISTGVISTGLVQPQQNATVAFQIRSMSPTIQIGYNNTTFASEKSPNNGIMFYCIPHRGAATFGTNMVGEIVLATLPTETAPVEKGILIRAYWIGIIGIASTLVWIVISYFVIKSSSRHFTDHREHVRKGLP